jgi:hypothetical protein
MREGAVYDTVRRLARWLRDEGVDYAVLDGMALVEHGYVRATADIDLLMRPQDLERFRERCIGRGYLPAFAEALKTFRDTETGVRIEIVTSGDFPGDGKPEPVAFPDPAAVAEDGDEFRVVRLETLVELKLASGLSAPHRLQDLADVLNLIRHAGLPRELGERLDPSVRAEYLRLWEIARETPAGEGSG